MKRNKQQTAAMATAAPNPEKRFIKGKLYKAAHPYDPNKPQFDHYKPADTGDYEICDCWVVDARGKVHPGYNVSPVPVHWSNLIR